MQIQLALDLGEMDDLLALAQKVGPWVDWVEMGTVLIKRNGISIVTKAKAALPGHIIVADLKTADGGGYEAEMAIEAGADIITCLAAATDATIQESISCANKHGKKVVVDLIGQPDPIARALELVKLKPHYMNLHRSTDARIGGAELRLDLLAEYMRQVPIPLSVAGGIDLTTIGDVKASGASMVVVGGAIAFAEDPVQAAKALKESIQ